MQEVENEERRRDSRKVKQKYGAFADFHGDEAESRNSNFA